MNKRAFLPFVLLLSGFVFAAVAPTLEPLPAPVANNAVTSMKARGNLYIFSLMGIGEDRSWKAVSNQGYIYDNDSGGWTELHRVPGSTGRIAAMAEAENNRVYLMGGAIVDTQGDETPVPDLNIYTMDAEEWLRGPDLPVGVADAIVGTYRDRIYIIGGRSRSGPVNDVQVYDPENQSWAKATPSPGAPVFGHAGAILGDTIVYVDGATSTKGDISNACWIGKIDRKNVLKISWSKLPEHPGTPAFRTAAGASQRDDKIYFVGGTPVVTNHKSEGPDGKLAQPLATSFAFNMKSKAWEMIDTHVPHPTMESHTIVTSEQGLVIIGGTDAEGKVSPRMRIVGKTASAPEKDPAAEKAPADKAEKTPAEKQ
ncbi:MAG TPA: kelch repeat-containing protein [Terriglobales bacterium]|jgi:N-acetylneuraminic acid mutarotase